MSNTSFFYLFIPFLAVALLTVNFIFATHTPYPEKNSTFECGFHSFLGQNRMQFNISFYIFGLLFLLFDLEILLTYPYPVSAQFNSLYGLCVILIFFSILALGFTFELGKNALKIDSRQYIYKIVRYIKYFNDINDNNINNNNKLLVSGFFNPKTIRKIYNKILSWIIVLSFFSFIPRFFISQIDHFWLCLILTVLLAFLANIIRHIFLMCANDADDSNGYLKSIVTSKDFIHGVLSQSLLLMVTIYPFMYVLKHYDKLPWIVDKYYNSNVEQCEDFIYQEWIDILNRIKENIENPNSRINLALKNSRDYDRALTNLKDDVKAKKFGPNWDKKEVMDDWKAIEECIPTFKEHLDNHYYDFTKYRGDLKRSAFRIRDKFASLPDSHDGKSSNLNDANKYIDIIKNMGSDIKNKRHRQ